MGNIILIGYDVRRSKLSATVTNDVGTVHHNSLTALLLILDPTPPDSIRDEKGNFVADSNAIKFLVHKALLKG